MIAKNQISNIHKGIKWRHMIKIIIPTIISRFGPNFQKVLGYDLFTCAVFVLYHPNSKMHEVRRDMRNHKNSKPCCFAFQGFSSGWSWWADRQNRTWRSAHMRGTTPTDWLRVWDVQRTTPGIWYTVSDVFRFNNWSIWILSCQTTRSDLLLSSTVRIHFFPPDANEELRHLWVAATKLVLDCWPLLCSLSKSPGPAFKPNLFTKCVPRSLYLNGI